MNQQYGRGAYMRLGKQNAFWNLGDFWQCTSVVAAAARICALWRRIAMGIVPGINASDFEFWRMADSSGS
jgi:hypothetical protein